jgi:hypothetical protein
MSSSIGSVHVSYTTDQTSPVRRIARRSSSPGRPSGNEASAVAEFSHHGDYISNSRITQSFVGAGGLFSAASSASYCLINRVLVVVLVDQQQQVFLAVKQKA